MKDHKIWPWFIKLQNALLSNNPAVEAGETEAGD